MARYKLRRAGGVLDQQVGVVIHPTTHRAEWAAYVASLESETPDEDHPEPTIEPTAQEIAAQNEIATRGQIAEALRGDNLLTALRTRTPAQIDAYIETRVTDFASAKDAIRVLSRAVALLARERL